MPLKQALALTIFVVLVVLMLGFIIG